MTSVDASVLSQASRWPIRNPKKLTSGFEAVIRIAFTPPLGEAHENAVNLLRFCLQHKLTAQIAHGSEYVEASPIEQVNKGLAGSHTRQRNIAKDSSRLGFGDRGIVPAENAESAFAICIGRFFMLSTSMDNGRHALSFAAIDLQGGEAGGRMEDVVGGRRCNSFERRGGVSGRHLVRFV